MDPTLSRRGVLLALSASAACLRAEPVKLPRRIRLGIIGYDGHVSEVLSHLNDFPDIELAAVADAASDPQAVQAALRNPKVARARRYADYPEMLNRERLDCAAICNHN